MFSRVMSAFSASSNTRSAPAPVPASSTTTTTITTTSSTTSSATTAAITTPLSAASFSSQSQSQSSSSTATASVWEWEDSGVWRPFDLATQQRLESKHAKQKPACKLTINNTTYQVDLQTLQQTNTRTGYVRKVRRVVPSPVPGSSSGGGGGGGDCDDDGDDGARWQWDCDGVWQDFDAKTTDILETAKKAGATTLPLSHDYFASRGGYTVDFQAMVQQQNRTKFSRKIRRVRYDGSSVEKPATFDVAATGGDLESAIGWQVLDLPPPRVVETVDGKDVVEEEHECPVCLCGWDDEDPDEWSEDEKPVHLPQCGPHYFHRSCIVMCFKDGKTMCPVCKIIYATVRGNMPKGDMTVTTHPPGQYPLSGYSDVGTIVIQYTFHGGMQSEEHYHPGTRYNGTSRTAYLPDNPEGREVLALLRVAFDRRLTFTIGRSVTTGVENTVVWNGIHHKTNTSGGNRHFGYPDPTYCDRVKLELASVGVRSDTIDGNPAVDTPADIPAIHGT